ncbi:hypothetical protein N4G70_29025 [Streptomyces sp. ASQP_92]|nr:hypothetical protein [Streptomyces sp. ASQP_92]MCT9092884.1 hypothetical protein [Streptomyces sp. ASQP_92]
MATVLEPITMSDDLWHSLTIEHPDSCGLHRCWVDQCPARSHDEAAGGEV